MEGFCNNDELLEGLRQKNPAILKKVYERCKNKVIIVIIKKKGTKIDGEDLYQEAFMVLCEKVMQEDFRLETKICNYLVGIAKNLWNNKNRKNEIKISNNVRIDDLNTFNSLEPIITEMIIENERVEIMRQAINKLSGGCNEFFQLSYIKGMSKEEIIIINNWSGSNYYDRRKSECGHKLKTIIKQNALWLSYFPSLKKIP